MIAELSRFPKPIPDAVRSELMPKPESIDSEAASEFRDRTPIPIASLSYQIYYLLALTNWCKISRW